MTRATFVTALTAATLLVSSSARAQTPSGEAQPKSDGTATAKRGIYRPPPPPTEFSPPSLSISDAVHDWGTAYRGEVIEHSFVIANKGGAPLSIQDVKPNCGCTVPKGADYKRVLAPGDETRITLSVDTGALKGAVKKYAEVLTNVQGEENKLWMQGQVDELFLLKPPTVQIQVIRKGPADAPPTIVEMATNLGKKVKIASLKPAKDLVRASLKEIEPGEKFEVTLTPNLKDEKNAFLQETLETQVEIEGKKIALRLPISVTLKDRIEVLPAKSIYFTQKDTGPLAQPGTPPIVKELKLQSIGGPSHAFNVVKAESRDKVFSATVEPIEAGKRYKLLVTLEKLPEKAQRFVRDMIQISTDDPELPVIEIPAMARF